MPQVPEPSGVSAALERVYARPELAERQVPGYVRLISDLWEAFTGWLGSLLRLPAIVSAWSPLLLRFLLVALFLLAAFSALYLVWRAVEPFVRGTGSAPPRITPAGVQIRSAEEWDAIAERAEAGGRYREAAIALYHATLLRLEERGIVRFDPSKTPGDYRRETGAVPAVSSAFDAVVRAFLPLAFGSHEPDRRALGSLRTAVSELVHA